MRGLFATPAAAPLHSHGTPNPLGPREPGPDAYARAEIDPAHYHEFVQATRQRMAAEAEAHRLAQEEAQRLNPNG